jgi:predicted O-methyltransferase YrrM
VSHLFTALHYAAYRLTGKTRHDIHSPFVFGLLTEVIQDKKKHSAYERVEKVRMKLLGDDRFLNVSDLGAGSKTNSSPKRKVRDICRNAEKNKKYGQLLFRLAKHFQPSAIFDLGTSLGVTTLYFSEAAPAAKIVTIEGCPETAAIADSNFREHGSKNIELVIGNFDDVLQPVLDRSSQLPNQNSRLFFFDGNHQKEPTLRYFEHCIAHADNDSVFIFDDIHWSAEMEEAWAIIKKDERVTVTIDLFFLGIVFIRREQAKEDFIVRF